MLAATEAALRGGALPGMPLAVEDMHSTAAASGGGRGDVAGGSGSGEDGIPPLDLHGLSAAEARAAVLTALSQLQVRKPADIWVQGVHRACDRG